MTNNDQIDGRIKNSLLKTENRLLGEELKYTKMQLEAAEQKYQKLFQGIISTLPSEEAARILIDCCGWNNNFQEVMDFVNRKKEQGPKSY